MDGPSNYLGDLYRAIPIGITVEGADIMTRNLIIFGQGAIRCHPWLLKEIAALESEDQAKALIDFDEAFWAHAGHSFKTLGRAWLRSWTGGWASPAPPAVYGEVRLYYKQLGRYTAAFALLAEVTFLTLGKSLKRQEMLSARLGDILSQLYFLSAVLKRWEDDGRKEADLSLVRYCMENGFSIIENRCDAVLRNMPNRIFAGFIRLMAQPLGIRQHGPSDGLIKECANILLSPSEARDRLTSGLYYGKDDDAVAKLEKAFELSIETAPLREKMKKARVSDIDIALQKDFLTIPEAEKLKNADKSVSDVIRVDDFSTDELFSKAVP
jgi:acyl-CoA dehydrogenase